MNCAQPGCGGTIQAGYCDACGLAAAAAAVPADPRVARLTPDEDRRIELVDMANAIRPRTLT
jgi:hypothetical protein